MPYANPTEARHYGKLRQRKYRLDHPTWRRDQHLRLTFGMTQDDWAWLFLSQGGKCASCRTDTAGRTAQGREACWHTDHNPNRTKEDPQYVRGILCHWCNIAAHRHQTSTSLRSLADYLEQHP